MAVTLKELAESIGAEVVGDASMQVSSAATLEEAEAGQVSFLANQKYAAQLETTRASAVIVAPSTRPSDKIYATLLKMKDPYFGFAQAVVKLHGHRKHPHAGIHPGAHVDPTATIGPGTIIYPGAFVGPRVKVGRDCILYPNCVVYDDCILGDRVIIHACAVIGVDGYGFASHKDDDGVVRHHKIPQVGNVVVEDDVEIGSSCSISRAALGSTVIGTGTKIDGNVALGHGVRVGPHCLLVAQVGIAGSTTLGHHVTMAGQVGVAGHLKIGNGVTLGAKTGIMSNIPDGATLLGYPGMPSKQALRVYSILTQLPELVDRVKKLEQQMGTASAPSEGAPTE